MPNWDDIASDSGGLYEPANFESAAYRLVAEQVLYHSDRLSRTDYGIVERYERDFRQALAPLGIDLEINRELRYACAIPKHARSTPATTTQTLLALVLRALFDDAARRGDLSDDGEVFCETVELAQRYALMTHRELPPKTEFDNAMKMLQRWGIARTVGEAEMEYTGGISATSGTVFAIRPAIVQLLGESALARLAAWAKPDASAPSSASDTDHDDDGENSTDQDIQE
ncbi:DUF4194 domain-containing protein [Pandoraea pnomenusa]|uniref:DUF4194 domain-containing protein n=1 Tax=Pandoraea pnomenusa TaxID=93220 RepID=UPI00333EA0BD